ncbi:flagellar hook-associated protein FlgL [Helicobacter saguini]|uniref:Flagellar hook-associated protein FlgL n=1 Tax=Helicobacter saguini TaxID=1548018 RepID=A0A347VS29_9HELI|nr:flagellar hook-associated protein FlgL [Helicobacter saguini]MWV62675.1 flagellar hook-associated protein FlgL [Helicobacter saguini]MWV66653.1 flagellar hook-associated protein FlgL [Helicobacter saguini]MWV69003.1 flagellar hook-associated protein FlgL [Helicobacter saguini]MWV71443.1 flagellar hook-associated protein FlgL [Helicobacter saguini]TLD94092.1 flagellar hook-associated protein FlgL [Helicobacter saguini]
MRVTFGTKYNQILNNNSGMTQGLNDLNTKIASGKKIQYGWQDASVANQNLKLEYDEVTLEQGIDVAKSAETQTLNSDKALQEISLAMVQFKQKLLHAANDLHTPTSREALARDLEATKAHIINIGNTSIGGNFIFSGSKVGTQPFDMEGNYYGNDEELNALISSKNLVPFNITGEELFYGIDNDKHRLITTNERMLNQTRLHPATMDKSEKHAEPAEVYINEENTLRDLIGDNDNDTSNNGKEYFYVQGVNSRGQSFKSKFALDVGYSNERNATKVRDLLDRIGVAFGNTNATKVVDVRLNNWGQIEIKDLKTGSSSIDFHMISSEADVDDLNDLEKLGARTKIYSRQNLTSEFSVSSMRGVNDLYDNRVTHIPTTLIRKDNVMAEIDTKLEDIMAVEARYIKITGTPPNEADGSISNRDLGEPLVVDIKGMEVRDLFKAIKEYFGGNVEVDLDHGQISVWDKNVKNKSTDTMKPPFDGPRGLSIQLTSLDEKGDEVNGFTSHIGKSYTKTQFEQLGSKIRGNIVQSISGTSVLAKDNTKLIEVTDGSLNGKTYGFKFHDHNGIELEASLTFTKQGSFLELPKQRSDGTIKIPLFNPDDEPPAVTISEGDKVTYRQLMDAMSIALNYSNEDDKTLSAAQVKGGKPTQAHKDAYEELLTRAKVKFDIGFDSEGKITIQDNVRSVTRMTMMFYDRDQSKFDEDTIYNSKANIRLNANASLVVDDPKIHFFKGLNDAIQCVRDGIYRAGALTGQRYDNTMQSIGIQNAIEKIDHLSDHIEKIISKNGAHTRTFQNSIARNEIIKTQVTGIKGETIGTDLAETYNKFTNLSNNYQAVLTSTNRINNLSLVNYLN